VEREIITQKYLDPSRPTDLFIYLELGMKKEAYYKKKKSAIYSMAKALGIIWQKSKVHCLYKSPREKRL